MQFQLGYVKELTQLPLNIEASKTSLEGAGWKLGADGIRVRAGKPLALQLYSQSTTEYAYVTQQLQQAWQKIGVRVDVILQSDDELQKTISRRDYGMLLYGISVGQDPDVFAYWHSSQANVLSSNRLNFSEYKSTVADKALEGGRTRVEPALRTAKYRPFLEAWRNDAPALMLYQPRYLYVTDTDVDGLKPTLLNASTDRYGSVEQWAIKRVKVTN
jgi:peptide/nickel transport system substrate-binding protein